MPESPIPADPMPPRQGPRPLPMHLGLATWTWLSSRAALPLLRSGSPIWKNPGLEAEAERLRSALDAAAEGDDTFDAALDREIRRRLDRFLAGIEAYRHHPYRRDLPDPPTVWQEGTTRLLDYGGDGPPVLLVPSLVNRFYVLDLSAECSLVRTMAGRGLRPLVVDWDRPGPAERAFTLTDYIAGRLSRALDAARTLTGAGRIAVAGYCMGGNLALALARYRAEAVARLALLACPWDFHGDDGAQGRALAAGVAPLWPAVDALGEMPVDMLQLLFSALDPYLAVRKFTAFGSLPADSPKAARFVALEDWLNDGVGLVAPVARECIEGWYGENRPGRGTWRVAGEAVRPEALDLPVLGIVPAGDRIVPPASADALIAAIPGAQRLHPALGHIGIVVSAGAPRAVWDPLIEWLGGRSGK